MSVELTPAMKVAIDAELGHYPEEKKQSAIIGALMSVQRLHQGYLSNALIEAVADYMGLAHITAYEVATFYSMFNLKPCGRYQLSVCSNIACMLNGSESLLDTLKETLGIEEGEVSQDGLFSYKQVSCLGHCDNAPMLQVNDQSCHMKLSPETLKRLLADIPKGAVNDKG